MRVKSGTFGPPKRRHMPMMFGSMPVPLMFLPIVSIISTSSWSKGTRGSSVFATFSSAAIRRDDLVRAGDADGVDLLVGVLDDVDTGEDVRPGDGDGGGVRDVRAEADGVHLLRAVPLAHADGDHLRDAALDLAPERRMRLDAVDDDHAVRLARHPVVDRR